MALPEGVTTATVTAGVPVSHTGAPVKAYLSIEPSVFLVHTATGTPLVDFLEELDISEGTTGYVTLPHTDQAGFQDESGNAYTNWYYTARVTYSTSSKAKTKAPKVKVFQLATGQTVVDLDALPGGAPALPYTAPVATVTSVAGLTGPVTGAQLAALPELTATIDTQVAAPLAAKLDKALPATAGARAKRFNAELSLYNATPANMRGFRNALAKARSGSLVTFSFLGDSKIAGLGTNGMASINGAASAPGAFRTALAGRGYPIAGTGPVFAFSNPAVGQADTRWTFAGTWSGVVNTPNVNFRSSTVAGSTATFTSDLPGTVVEIRTLSNSGPFTYSIDGGAAVTVTPSGSNVVHTTTVTGLADTTHTVVLTTTTTTATYALSVCVRRATGFQVANHGLSGSNTTHWIALNWFQAKAVAEALPSDGVFISLGTNDSGTNVGVTNFKTSMTSIINAHKALGRPVMLINPTAPATTHVAYANWTSYVAAQYDLADSLDIPLLDLNDIHGTQAQAMAAGTFFDEVHEKEAGYALNAASILAALYR